MAVAEDTFLHRHAFFGHLKQRVPIGASLDLPRPPVIVIALTVECAFAGDGNILPAKRVDERRIVEQLDTFPTRKDHGKVVLWVLTELDGGAFRDFEVDVVFEVNWTSEIRAGRNDDFAATGLRALVDDATESGGAIGATISFEMERAIRKTWWFDTLEDRRHHRPPRIVRGKEETRGN